MSINFQQINAAALRADVLHRWLPGGREEAGEYVALNPTRADANLGSFRISLKQGKWCDFATNDKGGDLISLGAYIWGVGQADAARKIAGEVGIEIAERKEQRWPSSKPKALLSPPANMLAPDLAKAYLTHRLQQEPIMPSTKVIGWKSFPYLEKGDPPKHLGDFPCIVFETIAADGRRHAHRIYAGPGGQGKAAVPKPKKAATKVNPDDDPSGCSVLWGDPRTAPIVIVCEGIETGAAIALAVREGLANGNVSIAAAISTAGVQAFIRWPANELVIAAPDHDANGAGMKAARKLGSRTAIEIAMPPDEGDFLDMLLEHGMDAVRDCLNDSRPFVPSDEDAAAIEPPRQVIQIQAGRIDRRVADCERVLGVAGTVYQRGTFLMRVARISDPSSAHDIRRASGSLVMMPIDAPFLQSELCRVAEFQRWSKTADDWVKTDPQLGDVRSLLSAAGHWPNIPALTGITEVPVIANDGRIIEAAGHDEATGIYFDPGSTKFPKVPVEPTRDDALQAAKVLEELLSGFPFVDGIARSVALAELLTPFKRPFLRAAPMFLNTAPKMGSGKTLLATVVSYIATGNPPASMSQEENREEEKKRMLALLMAGSAVTVIDNIERPLKSDTLCTVLTEPVWKERILGKSEEVKVSTATTWIATGNNLEVAGDLSTRSLVCTIDPECERPEEREFKLNLHEYVPSHRGELATACLTVLKAYWLARQRGEGVEGLTVFGRFEGWSQWVREPLVWLGYADPCQARHLVESRDAVREELGALLDAWDDCFGDTEQTLNAVLQAVENATAEDLMELKGAMAAVAGDNRGAISVKRLGKYIARVENRIEGNKKFVRGGTHNRAFKWKVANSSNSSAPNLYEFGLKGNPREMSLYEFDAGTPCEKSSPIMGLNNNFIQGDLTQTHYNSLTHNGRNRF